MSAAEARALLAESVRFERRSMHWACSVCAALVFDARDQEKHRQAHAALATALSGDR